MSHNMVHKTLSILTLPPSLASLTISLGFVLDCPALTKFLYLHTPYAPVPLGTPHAIHLYVLSSVLFLLPEMYFFSLLSAHPVVTPKLRYIALWRYHQVLCTLNPSSPHIVLIQWLSSPLTLNATGTERLLFIFASCFQYLEHRFSVIVCGIKLQRSGLFIPRPSVR